MVPAYSAPVGAPVWIDLMTSDIDAASEFYSGVFGWTAAEPTVPLRSYRTFHHDGVPVAGVLAAPADGSAGPQDVWALYLRSDDADAALAAATAAGGTVIVPGTDIADLGRLGVLIDAAGAAVGVWQPGRHPGFTRRGEPGTPYWFDCMSQDYEVTTAFYTAVFGWRLREIGTGGNSGAPGPDRYSQALFDGAGPGGSDGSGEPDGFGGVMDARGMFGPGTPSFWQTYITVADPDATARRIERCGGELVRPAERTPFGTLGAAKDVNGALFLYAAPPGDC